MALQAPWKRDWLQVTPEDFERIVVEYLRSLDDLKDFDVRHRAVMEGPDGEFEIDAVATFEALGAEFVVLVECKHHRNPIKRELVQVLRDKVRSVNAHKGMLCATAPFQKGAIEYALSQSLALVHFVEGGPIYESRDRSADDGPCHEFEAYFVSQTETGEKQYSSSIREYLFDKSSRG